MFKRKYTHSHTHTQTLTHSPKKETSNRISHTYINGQCDFLEMTRNLQARIFHTHTATQRTWHAIHMRIWNDEFVFILYHNIETHICQICTSMSPHVYACIASWWFKTQHTKTEREPRILAIAPIQYSSFIQTSRTVSTDVRNIMISNHYSPDRIWYFPFPDK